MPLKVYMAVGAALLILTFVTTEIAQFDFGEFNIYIALVIASIKAMLVAFFFMHLWWDNKLMFVTFSIGLITLTVFIALTMVDTMDRGSINPETAGQINPKAEMYNSPDFGKGGHHGDAEGAASHDSTAADSTGAHIDSTAAEMSEGAGEGETATSGAGTQPPGDGSSTH